MHSQATESPEIMQGVLNLDPSYFFFFSLFFLVGQLENLLAYQGYYLPRHRIRFYLHSDQMTVSLTVSKILMRPENLGTWQGYDLARLGNIWGFTFTHL